MVIRYTLLGKPVCTTEVQYELKETEKATGANLNLSHEIYLFKLVKFCCVLFFKKCFSE